MGKLAYFPVVYHIHTEVLFTEVVRDERLPEMCNS